MRRVSLLLVAAILAATFAEAFASPETDEAKQHYMRGIAHYNLREYKDAVTEFEAAYRLVPDPTFLYNLGQCNRLMGNNQEALYFYRSYLRMQPDATNRDEVEERIRKLEETIATSPTPRPQPAPAPPSLAPRQVPSAAVSPIPPTPTVQVTRRPVYEKWWLWTVVGVAVAGAATGLAVALTLESSPRSYPRITF